MPLKFGCPWFIKFKGLMRDKLQFWFHEGESAQISSVDYVHTCELPLP